VSRARILAKAASAAHDLGSALAELASDGESQLADRDVYDSAHAPPNTTRRRFAELCRSGRIAGAYREGRTWVCARAAWHAARARKPRARDLTGSPPSLVDRADELLRRRGLRMLGINGRRTG
jgi:hypothetical protein